ncbi:unnamed protein product [Lactuca saligna]|uniref:PGG domain-containing protein n=1 Tax=Lactuca saligna TaxID=75948 RepID=A0AA36EEL1_LACSI|nr:unnamed protein product [Lactuca saligna]
MVFTREHKDLVIEGEKWMKSTVESYTITAALIITIAFAAAITVPGDSNQDKGIPIFTNNTAFTIFAISDAISLFSAVTSLLMFLSILTARFAEQDFLFKLLTKLIDNWFNHLVHLNDSYDSSFWCNVVLGIWPNKFMDSYSHRCVNLPTNYFICDLAVPSCPRLDECHIWSEYFW